MMETDMGLLEANNRLLEKRKAMASRTRLTSNAMSKFETPKCNHGIHLGQACTQCEEENKKQAEAERCVKAEKAEKEREEEEKARKDFLEKKKQNPQEWMKGVPAKFREASFDNFRGGDIIKKKCLEFISAYNRDIRIYEGVNASFDKGLLSYPGSIVFTGTTGCGKTHLAVSLWRELVLESRSREVFFITVPELLLEIRATFGQKKSFDSWEKSDPNQTEEQVINNYSKVELLILDDLGSEKTSDFTIQSLYLIIDRRNRELRPTIITTNLSLQEIEDNLGARIASRLADMTIIKINMPDYRKGRK